MELIDVKFDEVSPELLLFSHEDFGDVRVVGEHENPLFCIKDVCEVLEITNYKNVISRLDEDEKDEVHCMDPIGRNQKTWFCNESGLYSLIFRSNKTIAKKFKKWVTNDVLPQIRRRGVYELNAVIEQKDMEISELQRRRFLKSGHDTHIKISERMLSLNIPVRSKHGSILNENHIANIFCEGVIELSNGQMISAAHPDKKRFIAHLSKISRKMARQRLPDIETKHRSNLWTIQDYIFFGDAIIKLYIQETNFLENINLDFNITDVGRYQEYYSIRQCSKEKQSCE